MYHTYNAKVKVYNICFKKLKGESQQRARLNSMDRYVEELEPGHRGTDNMFNLGGHAINGHDEGKFILVGYSK